MEKREFKYTVYVTSGQCILTVYQSDSVNRDPQVGHLVLNDAFKEGENVGTVSIPIHLTIIEYKDEKLKDEKPCIIAN